MYPYSIKYYTIFGGEKNENYKRNGNIRRG